MPQIIREPNWFDKLKAQFEDNPIAVIGVGAMAVTATAKLIDSVSAAQGRKAYAKQINHKVKRESKSRK